MGTGGSAMDAERQRFFDGAMYAVDVQGWRVDAVHPSRPLTERLSAPEGAVLRLHAIHPHDRRAVPPADPVPPVRSGQASGLALETRQFALSNSGNRTLGAPKRSWKVELDGDLRVAGMSCLNLKSMYNDPSQMREALVWRIFAEADVVAPRHTYARFGVGGTYFGLFSVIEQVDRAFLADRFGSRHRGNLYKVYCGDLGPGTLEHRAGPDGDDSGRQYTAPGADPTYRLKSFSPEPDARSFDDLAALVRVVNGIGLPGGDERFGSDAFARGVRSILDVEPFLRWAGVNLLVGAWDNYFATPANYYLYNGGRAAGSQDLMAEPYFSWIPWDYDNTFGIDYVGTAWQYTDLLDWPSNTDAYWGHREGHRSRLPLVTNLLRNNEFRRYYLDHVEHLLDTVLDPAAVDAVVGTPGAPGLWDRVAPSAYLESGTPWDRPATGRQYTNDEVYRAGFAQQELRHGETFALGIHHYLRMRHDSARRQLADLRRQDPAGSSGATFGAPVGRDRLRSAG